MQISWERLTGAFGVVFAGLIAWFAGLWIRLAGVNLWIFRIGIFLVLVLALAAAVLWLRNRKAKQASAAPAVPGSGLSESDDIVTAIREAENRISTASRLPRGTRLSSLPIIFLVGDTGSGKTCIALQSGLEPELLSGHVLQDEGVAPTRLANFWFAKRTVLVEVGGKLLGDQQTWARLLNKLAPSRWKQAFGGGPSAPRAAVVCFDCEKLVKASTTEEITAHSRALRARLEQISQGLGISFPVYVLFTRFDRIPYFEDYLRNLTNEETTQVFGTTLPALGAASTGVYAEQESKRLKAALTAIFHSMAECRPGLLYREHNELNKAGIYEFPREFEKRTATVTQFLVDICRPSHLRSGPFLRGFYFTGVRLVEAQISGFDKTVVTSKPASGLAATRFTENATSIFRGDEGGQTKGWQSSTQAGSPIDTLKLKEWAFLSHIFSHVVLLDRAALGASGASTKAYTGRRILFGLISALALVWILGMTISFFSNRFLEEDVRTAVTGLSGIRASKAGTASVEDLRRLDSARGVLQRLASYEREGRPLHLRWGLYSGHELFQSFRSLYFSRFDDLLLRDTRNLMDAFLRSLNPGTTPAQAEDNSSRVFDTLKAYLITTSHPEKSSEDFLGPFLVDYWTNHTDTADRKSLAETQFKYYAAELLIDNPLPTPADTFAVDQGRNYLKLSSGAEAKYQSILTNANKKFPPFNFMVKHPEAEGVLTETKIVRGAFTKEAWDYVTKLIPNAEKYAEDDWVLGPAGSSAANISQILGQIRQKYSADYIREWREFLRGARVARFSDAKDASNELAKLSTAGSPLLLLLCDVTENTNVSPDGEQVLQAFRPVRDVVTPGCYGSPMQPQNTAYMEALSKAKGCFDVIQFKAPEQQEDSFRECNAFLVTNVSPQVSQIVKSPDSEKIDQTVRALLDISALASPPPPGGEFCAELSSLAPKYPFNPNAKEEASLDEFKQLFAPDTGKFSKFLKEYKASLDVAGGRYVPKAGSNIPPAFAAVINQARDLQNSLYPAGATQMQYAFTLKVTFPSDLSGGNLTLDGQTLWTPASGQASKTFTWPGTKGEAEVVINELSNGPPPGPWAIFHFLGSYPWTSVTGGYLLTGYLYGQGGNPLIHNGKPVNLQFELQSSTVPLFRKGYLSTLHCPPPPRK
jgi:type VI secretion system protein ImpL